MSHLALYSRRIPIDFRLIAEHFPHANVDRAITLLMNLSSDQANRKQVRDEGGVEALVSVMKQAPMDATMEHVMGALHNVLLTGGR